MRKIFLAALTTFVVLSGICRTASAQFPIKIPKIGKPKTEQTPTAPGEAKTGANSDAAKQNQTEYLSDPKATNTPQFLIETLEIKAHNDNKYWKSPNQNDFTSWYPQVDFDVLYAADAPKLRFQAEWFNPDGSLWFSEPLEFKTAENYFPHLRSPYESKDFDPKGIIAVGAYGLKITDTKTSQTVFQGKFKVLKTLPDANLKNKNLFYVENDWNLSVGYVGFMKNLTDYRVHTRPMAFFWFKDIPDTNQLEAELYYNNSRVATTDKGGNVNKEAERGAECWLKREVCAHSLISFTWDNFVVDNDPNARINNPNGFFTNDHAGEYTIKIFLNGDQVREAKFTVDEKGWIARNAFSEQIFLNDHRVAVPVKVLGTTEKWNRTSWKTDAFYGNPLTGFVAP